jgi:hypothetical protein
MFKLPSIFFTYATDDVNGTLNLRLSLPKKITLIFLLMEPDYQKQFKVILKLFRKFPSLHNNYDFFSPKDQLLLPKYLDFKLKRFLQHCLALQQYILRDIINKNLGKCLIINKANSGIFMIDNTFLKMFY